MSQIPLDKAEDAFRRFFPDDWRDRLRAWLAATRRTSAPEPTLHASPGTPRSRTEVR